MDSERLHAIIETQNEIARTALDLNAVMAIVVERAQQLTGAEGAVIELVDGDEMVYHVGRGTASQHMGLRLPVATSLSGECMRLGEVLHCLDANTDERVNAEAAIAVGVVSMVCVPLAHDGRTVGVLKVFASRPHAFSDADVQTLDMLSGVIGAHMAHASAFQKQRHDSRHDALTGLPNRRAFDERLRGEIARARRHGGRLVVGLLDLDRFKLVNDTYGHVAGDLVLRAVAANLARLRHEDAAYRFGGDEFALVLVETTDEGARAVLERIERVLSEDPECHGVGASWGIAGLAATDDDAVSLLARADTALYAAKDAKRAGRAAA